MKHPFEVRERVEEMERASLSTWATLASESKGRDRYEDPDPLRTAFQQDRDRLLVTDAFAKLAGKTHSFVPEVAGRGWRSHLSHTLATLSVARMMARTMRLNEDLVEAIALGHALGAPPFGPAGPEVVGEVAEQPFEVAEQSIRIVEYLETGLNLTWEVRDGILHQVDLRAASTLEGCVAAVSRRFAQALFDLRAAQRGGWVRLDDVPAVVRTVLGTDHEARVAVVVADVAEISIDRPELALSRQVDEAVTTLEAFLAEDVHGRDVARSEHDRAVHCMRSLAIYARANPRLLGVDAVGGIVDWLCAATDADIGDVFTATFRPSGTADR